MKADESVESVESVLAEMRYHADVLADAATRVSEAEADVLIRRVATIRAWAKRLALADAREAQDAAEPEGFAAWWESKGVRITTKGTPDEGADDALERKIAAAAWRAGTRSARDAREAQDAGLLAFLDTVSISVHVRGGRRYEAGPGFARHVIECARTYHIAARQQGEAHEA